MSRRAYLDGTLCVVIETGVPERHDYVQIGVGETWADAIESLEQTPVESVGRDNGLSAAVRYAASAGWCSALDTLVRVDVDLEEDDDDDDDDDERAHGRTFAEWLSAARRTDSSSEYDLRAAWRAGEDPTEYRATATPDAS